MNERSIKVVILGNSGFIGSAVFKRFQGMQNVSLLGYGSAALDLTSAQAVRTLLKELDRRTILIMAARSRLGTNSVDAFLKDVAMFNNLAQILSRTKVRKCVYFSSTSVYGNRTSHVNVTEEGPTAPDSLYGISRLFGEYALMQITRIQRLPLVIFRPCMIYGAGDRPTAYGPIQFLYSALTEKKIHLFGDGSEYRDYMFIDDLAEITVQFALGKQEGVFNLSTGKSHSFRQLVRLVRRMVQEPVQIVSHERDRPKSDLRLDSKKLFSVLPEFRFVPLETGLRSVFEYFRMQPYFRLVSEAAV